MEWKTFKKSEKQFPEQLINNKIKGFTNATKGLLVMKIVPERILTSAILEVDFEFKLVLLSNRLSNYKFEILNFGYNIDLYPVEAIVEESIFLEIFDKSRGYSTRVSLVREDAVIELIDKIFHSDRFVEIVEGLMKISEKQNKLFKGTAG